MKPDDSFLFMMPLLRAVDRLALTSTPFRLMAMTLSGLSVEVTTTGIETATMLNLICSAGLINE
jgi:hypothetical protein